MSATTTASDAIDGPVLFPDDKLGYAWRTKKVLGVGEIIWASYYLAMRAQSVMVFFYSDVDWLHSGAFVGMYISANNATFYVFECYDGQIGGQYGAIIVVFQNMHA
jgi:hypothetical protein